MQGKQQRQAARCREEKVFLSPTHSSVTRSHAPPLRPTARLCSRSVISADRPAHKEGGGGREGIWRAGGLHPQSRSCSRNPTSWKYVVGTRCRTLSSPNSSARPMWPDRGPLTPAPTCSDVICGKFLTLSDRYQVGTYWGGYGRRGW